MRKNANVHHPRHYGGASNPYEAIKVIEDLEKAEWYLRREIQRRKKEVAALARIDARLARKAKVRK